MSNLWSDENWGEHKKVNVKKEDRIRSANTLEENITKILSKNKFGYIVQRYSLKDNYGKEIAQTIAIRNGKRIRCPDIFVVSLDDSTNVCLRIEVKSHDKYHSQVGKSGFVRIECEKFDQYKELQYSEEVEGRIIFGIKDKNIFLWQDIDALDWYKERYVDKVKVNGKDVLEDFYYWDASVLNVFSTADDFFESLKY